MTRKDKKRHKKTISTLKDTPGIRLGLTNAMADVFESGSKAFQQHRS